MDLIIKGGTVVGPLTSYQADVGITDGQISRIDTEIEPGSVATIDASDKLVLPGGVDSLAWLGQSSSEDFASATIAAAAGGITTVVDCLYTGPGQSMLNTLEARCEEVRPLAHVDFSFHLAPTEWNENIRREVRELLERGFPSFIAHLSAMGLPGASVLPDGGLFDLMEEAAKFGGTVLVQGGNDSVASVIRTRMGRDGRDGYEHFPACLSPTLESEGLARASSLASLTSANAVAAGVSGAEALQALLSGRNRGVNLAAQTALHHLFPSLMPDDGPLLSVTPPRRTEQDSEHLWSALSAGDLEIVASHHRACSREQKMAGAAEIDKIVTGLPTLELVLPLLLSEGVRRGRMTPSRMVQVASTNPAMVMGLFPSKGILQVGSDADVVVMDAEKDWTVSASNLNMASDYSPFEGARLRGAVTTTILRGKVLVRDGAVVGEPGQGELLERQPLEEYY